MGLLSWRALSTTPCRLLAAALQRRHVPAAMATTATGMAMVWRGRRIPAATASTPNPRATLTTPTWGLREVSPVRACLPAVMGEGGQRC
jgi:hypothetical protein